MEDQSQYEVRALTRACVYTAIFCVVCYFFDLVCSFVLFFSVFLFYFFGVVVVSAVVAVAVAFTGAAAIVVFILWEEPRRSVRLVHTGCVDLAVLTCLLLRTRVIVKRSACR